MARPSQSDDDGASLFFFLAILGCIVVPWTLAMILGFLYHGRKQVEEAFPTHTEDGARVRQSNTRAMVAKRNAEVAKLRSRATLFTRGFVIRLLILGVLWFWLIYIIVQIRAVMATSQLYQNFDPYEILEVARGSKATEIKKAFRKASLKYHPDRNQGDPDAATKFIRMKKAYDALTDPRARRNYEMYGNPDGPVRYEIGMALPKISKEKQNLVLILFVLIFILGVPFTLLWFMSGTESVCPNGVLRSTMEALASAVHDGMDIQLAQELLLTSAESQVCPVHARDAAALEALEKELRPLAAKPSKASKKRGGPVADLPRKAELLLLAHLHRRHDLLAGEELGHLAADLETLLRRWRPVVLAMVDLAAKQGFGDAAVAGVELHRCLVQALAPDSPAGSKVTPLLQVPHFDAELLKTWRKGPRKAATLQNLVETPSDDLKTSLVDCGLDAQEVADVADFVATMPRLEVKKTQVTVSGERDVCQGDLATLWVTLERAHLREGEAAGAVHAPLFPSAAVREAWWLILTPAGSNAKSRCARIVERGREVVVRVKFKVPSAKKCRLRLVVACEAYEGLDVETQVVFEASPPKEDASDVSGEEDEEIELSEPGE